MTPLDRPIPSSTYALDPAPLFEQTWRRRILDRLFADLGEPVRVYTLDACPRCHVDSDRPCVTRSGRAAKSWHAGRQR